MTAHKHAESRIWIAVFDSIFILFYFIKNKQIASFNSSFSSQSYYPQLFYFFLRSSDEIQQEDLIIFPTNFFSKVLRGFPTNSFPNILQGK